MNISKLQIALIGGAIFFVVIVLLVLSGILPGLKDGGSENGMLKIWGFDKREIFNEGIKTYTEKNQGISINYQQKDSTNWELNILNAIARGESPDILILPSDYLKKLSDKLSVAPKNLITERELSQQFISSALFFLTSQKEILGIPLYVDPLVLYWNKDIFTKELIPLPPSTWDEFLETSQRITKKDSADNITISGSAMGRAINIQNAPEILTALFLQSGEKIMDETGKIILGDPINIGNVAIRPAESALRFFTEFSDQQKTSRSWSSSFAEAQETFLAGKTAMYIGFASEYEEMKRKNPHVEIGISNIPSLDGKKSTFGRLFAFVVPRTSQNYLLAWNFAKFFASSENSKIYSNALGLVSPKRDLFTNYQSDSIKSIFSQSALSLELWNDPDPIKSRIIFKDLIENMALKKDIMRNLLETAKAISENTPTDEKVQLENKILDAMRNFLVSVESYPHLKASEQFILLQSCV